jgi:hypothetical protein
MANYYGNTRILLLNWTEPEWLDHPSERSKWVRQRLSLHDRCTAQYLQRQHSEFCRRHPELPPPTAAVLYARSYRIAPPRTTPWTWPAAEQVPLFRWRPGVTAPPGCYAVEVHDWTRDPPGEFRWLRVRLEFCEKSKAGAAGGLSASGKTAT